MNEIFPIASGLAAGVILAVLGRRLRFILGLALSIVLGLAATLLSGEYKVSWEYLLVDIPLVAVSASTGILAARALLRRVAATRHRTLPSD